MTPKVSVVTCSHNRPELLREAIESMRAQTDPNWEHLIYDDHSTNRDVYKVLHWALRDSRVRVWRGQENLDRPAVLWNFMMDRAHGRYLTVLDDDNKKLPTFVEVMSRELDNDPRLDVVTCGWQVIYKDNDGPGGNYFLNLSTSPERLSKLSTCDGGAMLYRRSIFERAGYFSEALRTNEDWDWLRRAVHVGNIKNLHEVHSTYLAHKICRMRRADALGNADDMTKVMQRRLSKGFGVHGIYAPFHRLTQSQKDVCTSVSAALSHISWITDTRELGLVVSPFQLNLRELREATRGFPLLLSLHMEDPYALAANLERVQQMARATTTWVCTNDAATVPFYRKIVGDRVIVCPTLGADATLSFESHQRDIDLLVCGYAYPSRKRFITRLLPLLDKSWKIYLVGDEWNNLEIPHNATVLPTQTLSETYQLHARARAVLCMHRIHGDCSDGPVEPVTVNRGYMEGYSGARVFLDKTRDYHSLDHDDVIWYDGPVDCARALRTFLSQGNQTAAAANAFANKCRSNYTYQTRLTRILNCVRSPRFLAEIP